MATDASQFSFDEQMGFAPDSAAEPPARAAKPARGFAGLSAAQLIAGALLLFAAIWAMWTTREVMQLRAHKVVSVRLGELVNQFALAEARSGDDPDKVTARTRAFMEALDKTLKAHAAGGAVVLVGEAVVSSSGDDITAAVAADVAKLVPMPMAQAMPARLPVAPTASGAGGVGQAMLSAMGSSAAGQDARFGQSSDASAQAYPQAAGNPQGGDYSPQYSGGGDVQP